MTENETTKLSLRNGYAEYKSLALIVYDPELSVILDKSGTMIMNNAYDILSSSDLLRSFITSYLELNGNFAHQVKLLKEVSDKVI